MADRKPLYVRPPKELADMSDAELASWTRGVVDRIATPSPAQAQRPRDTGKTTALFALVWEPDDLSTAYGVIYAVQGLTDWHRWLWIPEEQHYRSVTEAELDRAFGSGPHRMMRISRDERDALIALELGPAAEDLEPQAAGVTGPIRAEADDDSLDDDAAVQAAAVYCRQGAELYFEGRYDEAQKRLEDSLLEDYSEVAMFLLGMMEAQRGDEVGARLTLSDLMDSDEFGDLAAEVTTFLELEWPIVPISAGDLQPTHAEDDSGAHPEGYTPAVGEAYVMGKDPWSDRLVLLPETIARQDVMFNHAVYERTTMGKVRAAPGALEVLEEALAAQIESRVQRWVKPRLGRLPDDYPVSISSILTENVFDYTLILPRLRTAKLAPQEVLDEFGQAEPPGGGFSMDYEGATWLDPADRDSIATRMAELGFQVREDQELIDAYLNV